MSKGLLQVQSLAMTDRTFRERLLADPVDAVKRAGLRLERSEMLTVQTEIERLKANKTLRELDEVFRTGALGW
jgi:hypothetical protein